jgi:hypothetical protein
MTIKQLKLIFFFLILVLLSGLASCDRGHVTTNRPQETPPLNQAMPYEVVGMGNLTNEDETRTVGLWYITSNEADSFEEYAQTTIKATVDMYKQYKYDFTEVMLIPQPEVKTQYAEAFYASDGEGAAGMTGSVPAVPRYWNCLVMDDVPYNEEELAVLKLWQSKQADFPNQDPLSSLSYDEPGLRHYIAETLNVPYEKTQPRSMKMVEYQVDDTVRSLVR